MILYRVLPWDNTVGNYEPGGIFYVDAARQIHGRFDIPESDSLLYFSQEKIAAVAEKIREFQAPLENRDFKRTGGRTLALASIHLGMDDLNLLDLDNPQILCDLKINPCQIATNQREISTKISREIFQAKEFSGFFFWSSVEATWKNAVLFVSRVKPQLAKAEISITPLTTKLPEVIEAAKFLWMELH